jgi:6-phosphogluconolactonase
VSDVEKIILRDRQEIVKKASEIIYKRMLALSQGDQDFHIVITGGSVGISILASVVELTRELDLSRLHIWWSDERFVSMSSPDRNELQARNAWLSHSSINEQNVHAFPADESGSIAQAAEQFAQHIGAVNPKFDLVLLGVGKDGHVASLFPEGKGIVIGKWVVMEIASPKPPAQRLSLSMEAINSAREVLLVVSGLEKSQTVSDIFSGVGNLPAQSVLGSTKTTWLMDKDAASVVTFS